MNKRDSIFFKISIFFAIVFFLINMIIIMPLAFFDFFHENQLKYFIFILFAINTLLIAFYYFLLKRLSPLVKKIENLNDSRTLFLRNILHELKTPITKGKLVSDTLEDNKKKRVLQRAFLRLEFLLEEFVKVEELASGKINLEKKEYRVVDLLDQSLDLLLIDKTKVNIYPSNTKIDVDFDVFSIALKNLIDNALKYNTNGSPEIFINKDNLIIKNKGEPLKKDFVEYLIAFNREYESINKGLGLGLYITNSVIKSHDFKLSYSYENSYHIFKIDFL